MNAREAHQDPTFASKGATARPEGRVAIRGRMMPLTQARALFVFAAGVSFLLSVYLWFGGQREQGQFVGLWVPSILALGALLTNGRGQGR